MTDTPETDAHQEIDGMAHDHLWRDFSRKLERERNEWKAKYIQQNKDLGCEMMDPNGTIWDYAKKVQHELTVVTKQRDQLEERLRVELGGHPETAPKDGTLFLANMGWPYLVVCVWNPAVDKWVYANLQVNLYDGQWNDTYFESEWEDESELKSWRPMPFLENNKNTN